MTEARTDGSGGVVGRGPAGGKAKPGDIPGSFPEKGHEKRCI